MQNIFIKKEVIFSISFHQKFFDSFPEFCRFCRLSRNNEILAKFSFLGRENIGKISNSNFCLNSLQKGKYCEFFDKNCNKKIKRRRNSSFQSELLEH